MKQSTKTNKNGTGIKASPSTVVGTTTVQISKRTHGKLVVICQKRGMRMMPLVEQLIGYALTSEHAIQITGKLYGDGAVR